MERLNFVADLNATHTFYAASGISDERKIAVRLVALNSGFVFVSENIEVVGNLLKLARSAADAGCAVAVVLAENELDVDVSCFTNTRTVRENHHSVLGFGVAGGNKALVILNFNNADSAGADFVKLFEIAKSRNVNIRLFCRFKNCCAVFDFNGNIINNKFYHLNILPPLSAP